MQPEPKLDAKAQVFKFAFDALAGQAVMTIGVMGIPDFIEPGSARSIAEIARESGCDERSLYRTLRFLASYGVFEERDGRSFAHTPVSQVLRTDAPESSRPASQLFHFLNQSMQEMEHSLRTSESALTKVLGMPIFEYFHQHPETAAMFDSAMTSIHGPETGAMLSVYNFSGIGTLADLGGGNGSLLVQVLNKYPEMMGIVMDLEQVVNRAKPNLEAAGLADRCTIHPVDFFEEVPPGADAYLMRHIIHDWNDEQSIQILKNCRKAVPPHGKLLLVEAVVPTGNDRSIAKDQDIGMLLWPGGMERTEQEYKDLFAASGFELVGITPTPSPVSVIEGRPV